MENKNLTIVSNPIVNQSLCTIRNRETDTQGVRLAARKLTRILLYEATKNLPQKEVEIETPVDKCKTKTINDDITIIISPILRAGLIFTDEAVDILPQATIRHIGMYRDEKTLKPVWYYNKVPMPV
ncbi:uracil phosphoribosyltransferase, partial [bacterium]|nr:uracil phosphoribosyltransferase [bacterium]